MQTSPKKKVGGRPSRGKGGGAEERRPRGKGPITSVGGARSGRRKLPRSSGTEQGRPAKARRAAPVGERASASAQSELRGLFPAGLGRQPRFGLGVLLAVADRQGRGGEVRYARVEQFSSKPARRPRAALLGRAEPGDMAKMLTGLAHADRIRVARAVMTGANTHALLSEAVGLKTGPLYHHLRELERAGLLTTTERNRYDLTELGRVALLVVTVLGTWTTKRRRPWRVKRLGPRRG